jgi:RNA-splicing ligase RtcB
LRDYKSVGTLGGGNHFIEVDRSESGEIYVVVHSGNRHLGCEVADYYQTEGYNALRRCAQSQLEEVMAQLKAEGRQQEIQSTIMWARIQ